MDEKLQQTMTLTTRRLDVHQQVRVVVAVINLLESWSWLHHLRLKKSCQTATCTVYEKIKLLLLLQPFYDPLSGTTQVSRYKDKPF